MKHTRFPPLALADWQETRDTIHQYTRVLGKIRQALAPRQKHWWHASLHATAVGLTTTPIPAGKLTFDLSLDFAAHLASLRTSRGDQWDLVLEGQPVSIFCRDTCDALGDLGIRPAIDHSLFADDAPRTYEDAQVETYWRALSQVDVMLKEFKGTLPGESSPVQLWPHHFDLSLVWFSGRQVPGQEPANEAEADEQMAFGFSTGDAGIPDPYFYITAYPWPAGLLTETLPAGAQWHTEGWQGAVLPYETLRSSDKPRRTLLNFWRTVHAAGAQHMLA